MEHGGAYTKRNRTPGLYYGRSGGLNGRISTSDDENAYAYVFIGVISNPSWFHISIRVCQSSLLGTICARGWGDVSKCASTVLTGTVIPFDIDSTVYVGYSPDNDVIPPKM